VQYVPSVLLAARVARALGVAAEAALEVSELIDRELLHRAMHGSTVLAALGVSYLLTPAVDREIEPAAGFRAFRIRHRWRLPETSGYWRGVRVRPQKPWQRSVPENGNPTIC
jgi:hypothetical protein